MTRATSPATRSKHLGLQTPEWSTHVDHQPLPLWLALRFLIRLDSQS